jgi:hypothetical protein
VVGSRGSFRPSDCLCARFNSSTTGRIRIKFGMGIVPRGAPSNRTVEHPKIGSNKIADKEICEVNPHAQHYLPCYRKLRFEKSGIIKV